MDRTQSVFEELARAAAAGYGSGVDEYEAQVEHTIPDGARRRVRRTRMIEHLAQVLTVKEKARASRRYVSAVGQRKR